jgi:DNA-binding transcriptional MocR family regulator
VQLPDGVDALHLAERALARGISVTPGPLFSASGAYRNCLRLNCGHIWTDRFDAAVETLAGEIIRLRCS